jgi:hypothetical protein
MRKTKSIRRKKMREDSNKCLILFRLSIDEKNPDIDEILHAITIWIKKVAENIVETFEKEHSIEKSRLSIIHQSISL